VSATQVNGQGGYAVTIQVVDSATPTPNTASTTLNFGVYSDASYGGCQMFPADSIYNQRADSLPVDANPSHQIPSSLLTSPIHPDFGHGFYPGPGGIPFMRVPSNGPTTNIFLTNVGQIDQSGPYFWPFPPYPIPVIEGTSFGPAGGDHHTLILESSTVSINGPQSGPCTLYETYSSSAVPTMYNSGTSTWTESAGIHYVLNRDEIALSAATLDAGAQDSPGIPMVPLLIRYNEVPLGVQHPLRITMPSPTNWFVWPATGCCAGSGPPQGLLYRLKASVNWQAVCPVSTNPQAATVLQALQQYGAYMSDHGRAGFIQGVPDVRWDDNDLACIKSFPVSDLEVVDNSALEVSAISGQTMPYVVPAALPNATVGTAYSATISAVGGNPANRQWSVSSGALPPGLLLAASTGTIGGTPSSVGSSFSFSIIAADTTSGYASQPQPFVIGVLGSGVLPDLTIAKTHTGNFRQGDTGDTYAITVSNSGGAPSNGTVTVTETVPAGLTLVSIAGTGWTCPAGGNTCTRADALASGASYAAITVTVNPAADAPATVTNTATVSGGGEINTANDTATDPTTVTSSQYRITTSSVPVATQYQSYSTTLTATGGVLPYTWSVVSSTGVSLPEGMSLNPATGVVSATGVNGQGGYAVSVQVADGGFPSPSIATATLNFGVNSDGSYGGCQMFPPDSIYNQRIDLLPVDTTPSHQIPSGYLGRPIHPDFGHGFYPYPGGIPFMRVPANQPTTQVILSGDGQIDLAGTYAWPFPAWPNALLEGTSYGGDGGDHHTLILQSSVNNISGPQAGACTLYETYQSTPVPSMFNAASGTWLEAAGIHYVLTSNEIAASSDTLDAGAQDSPGIPMVPLLIKYWEVPLGARHPLRITMPSPTNGWVWPGTGCCGGSGPPQGLLYRLKASVNWQAICPASTNPQAATVLQALEQYGAYMSDHGSAGFIQGVPDVRWDDNDLACIKNFPVSDLEVVDNSAVEVSAITGQTKPYVVPAALPNATVGTAYSATISAVGGAPANRQWSVSSGALPAGLLLAASTGTISGTPSSSTGSPFSFGITATDTASGYASQPQPFAIVCTDPAPVAVPNVVGQTQAAAATAITGAGLVVGTVTTASSSTVASGSVISESPVAGTLVTLGSAVNLVVSTGQAPVVVSFSVLFGSQSYNVIGTTRNRLPWQITGIQVVFSKPITSGNLASLGGVAAASLSGLNTNTLTWTINPIAQGSFPTKLAGTGPNALMDAQGNPLAGGAGFAQTLKVLWADINDDGVVNASDLALVNGARSAPYSVFADLNGDGVVDINDIQIVRVRIGTELP
jgi:uncharacterized repeat protein (TIGR01451 family)